MIIGGIESNAPYEVGLFSWVDKAIFTLGTNPLHNSDIFYPYGADINDGGIIYILFSPITHILGPIASYNLYVLSTFVIAGLGAYLLVRHLTGNEYASFLAGIIYAFSPIHFAHTDGGIIHISSIQWLPFYVIFLIRMFDSKNFRDTLLCGLFFGLNAASSWTLGVTSAIFSVLFIGYIVYRDRNAIDYSDLFKKLIIFSAAAFLLIAPFAYVLVDNMVSNSAMVKPLNEKIFYSADLLAFFTPSQFNPFVGQYFAGIYDNYTGGKYQNTVYVGLIALGFAAYGLVKSRKDCMMQIFAISALLFFILALGPYLHIYGAHIFGGSFSIPLPGLLFDAVPILSMIRCPSRVSVMLMMMLATLAGYGFAATFEKVRRPGVQLALFGLLSLIVLVEFAHVMPFTSDDIPVFYTTISKDVQDYAIMELPLGYSNAAAPANKELSVYMLYQVTHDKAIAGGPLSREGLEFRENLIGSPLRHLWYFDTSKDITDAYVAEVKSALKYYDIRYIVYHKDLTGESYKQKADKLLPGLFGQPCYDDEQIRVYEVSTDTPTTPFVILRDGWYSRETSDGEYLRWMGEKSGMTIIGSPGGNVTLAFNVTPFDVGWELETTADGVVIDRRSLPISACVTMSVPLKEGKTDLAFRSPNGTGSASERYMESDPRMISFAFRNVTVRQN